MVDHIRDQNEALSLVLNFTRPAQDWELESVSSFLEFLYLSSTRGYGLDKICWCGSAQQGFQVKSYYRALLTNVGIFVPWKSIW